MILILSIFIFIQNTPTSNESTKFIIAVGLLIIGAIITTLASLFKTQSDRRYKEFNELKKQSDKNTSDIEKNTIYDKNRNDKFKDHESRMRDSERSIKEFLTEYKKDAKSDWRDFKREVKSDFEGFKTEVKSEISALRDEIHNKK